MNKENIEISARTLETQAEKMNEEGVDRLTVVQTLMKLAEKNPLVFIKWLLADTNQKEEAE